MDDYPLFSRVIERRDPAERKHGGSPASVHAHRRARGLKRFYYSKILGHLRLAGSQGRTAKELALVLGVGLNHISGRCTELVQMGFVRRLAIRRDGAAVLIHRSKGLPGR